MLQLNIISPELKKDIKYKYIYKNLKRGLLLIVFSSIFYSVILLIANFYLENHYELTKLQSKQFQSESNETEKTISSINKQINDVIKIQKSSINWLILLDNISRNTNDDIVYNKINFNKDSGLLLAGNSKTRESLLILKNYLEKSLYLKDVNFPIQNLLEKENINFEIKAAFSNYEFNKE